MAESTCSADSPISAYSFFIYFCVNSFFAVLAAMWADEAAVDSGTPLMLLETLAALRVCPEGTNTFRREKKKLTRDRFSSQFGRWCSFLPELWDENVWAETELTRRGDVQRPRDGIFFFFIAAIEVPSLLTPPQPKSPSPSPSPLPLPPPSPLPYTRRFT